MIYSWILPEQLWKMNNVTSALGKGGSGLFCPSVPLWMQIKKWSKVFTDVSSKNTKLNSSSQKPYRNDCQRFVIGFISECCLILLLEVFQSKQINPNKG